MHVIGIGTGRGGGGHGGHGPHNLDQYMYMHCIITVLELCIAHNYSCRGWSLASPGTRSQDGGR